MTHDGTRFPQRCSPNVVGDRVFHSKRFIAERGYKTVTTKAALKDLGFSANQQLVPALLIPISNVHGEVAGYQSRPDKPRVRDGKPVKYETWPASE